MVSWPGGMIRRRRMIRVEANNYHKRIFLKLRRRDGAFSFKPFQFIAVFNAVFVYGNIAGNLLIVSTKAYCKKKVYQECSLARRLINGAKTKPRYENEKLSYCRCNFIDCNC